MNATKTWSASFAAATVDAMTAYDAVVPVMFGGVTQRRSGTSDVQGREQSRGRLPLRASVARTLDGFGGVASAGNARSQGRRV